MVYQEKFSKTRKKMNKMYMLRSQINKKYMLRNLDKPPRYLDKIS
jgi:hypothetical protein